LQVDHIQIICFEFSFLLRPLLGFPSSQFLQQPVGTGRATESFDVVPLTVVLFYAIFITESRGLRDRKAASIRSIDI